MKRSPLRRKSQSPTAQAKERIQALLRQIVIASDKGCFLRFYPDAGACGGYRKDGELILQADHLNTRARNISYGDCRLVVCACARHHLFWKRQNPDAYMKHARHWIGPERSKLLDKVMADQRIYPMGFSDWLKIEAALTVELRELERVA